MNIRVTDQENRDYLQGVLDKRRFEVTLLEREPTDDPLARDIMLESVNTFIKELEESIAAFDLDNPQ